MTGGQRAPYEEGMGREHRMKKGERRTCMCWEITKKIYIEHLFPVPGWLVIFQRMEQFQKPASWRGFSLHEMYREFTFESAHKKVDHVVLRCKFLKSFQFLKHFKTTKGQEREAQFKDLQCENWGTLSIRSWFLQNPPILSLHLLKVRLRYSLLPHAVEKK